MKRFLLIFVFAVVATLAAMAQQISVVSTTGATTLYRTLQEAIEGADPGSDIYLPGGGFPISDEVKITKKLTIIGIGHKSNNDNVDGVSTIGGNLFFNEGSSSSAVIGCYVTGGVTIYSNVSDVLIKYCNVGSVYVQNRSCLGTTVNQCYLRSGANFEGANGYFTHNISYRLWDLQDGIIEYNIFTSSDQIFGKWQENSDCARSFIKGNIVISSSGYYGERGILSGNMCPINWNVDPDLIKIDDEWTDVFVNFNGGAISPVSDFHFKEAYKQYENQVGVYAGGVDFDKQLAPVPYIVGKRVDEQTDASGKLNVKIRVKAGQ